MAKPSAADAHDAGPVRRLTAKPSVADAHDARPVGLMQNRDHAVHLELRNVLLLCISRSSPP